MLYYRSLLICTYKEFMNSFIYICCIPYISCVEFAIVRVLHNVNNTHLPHVVMLHRKFVCIASGSI